MNEIVLSSSRSREIERSDPLFGRDVERKRLEFLTILRQAPAHLQAVVSAMESGDLYRAKLPRDAWASIRSGAAQQITRSGTGLWTGMVRKVDGKQFLNQAGWEKVNLPPSAFADLNRIGLNAAIAEISEQLVEIDRKLDDLRQGQHTDRIAKVIAGFEQYKTAQLYEDPQSREPILANALQSLIEGRASLVLESKTTLEMKVRAPTLTDRAWRFLRVNKPEVDYFREISPRIAELTQSLSYIAQASVCIVRIHAMKEEWAAANAAHEEYLGFLEIVTRKVSPGSVLPHTIVSAVATVREMESSLRLDNVYGRDLVIETTFEELRDELRRAEL